MELSVAIDRELLHLFDELQAGNVLRDHHIVPGPQVFPRHGERHLASKETGGFLVLLPLP